MLLPEFYNQLGAMLTDPAARDDVPSLNELILPLGRPVIVHLSSKDVVHSFALPRMRVKQDAIPGVEQPVWFPDPRGPRGDRLCTALRTRP